MKFRFKCPYCFKEISDDEVLFRSQKVYLREEDDFPGGNPLPEPYDDIEMFEDEYEGVGKEEYLEKYKKWKQWELFHMREDPVYENFWEKYGGTTEKNLTDDKIGIEPYNRRIIIDPKDGAEFGLKKQDDGTYIFRDADGMSDRIEFETGECSDWRVCPHCHNPLPKEYGKNHARFVTVVGIAGSGKTVFLSQLLKHMNSYCAKVRVSAITDSPGVRSFLAENSIADGTRLPNSTPKEQFQQPLFFKIMKTDEKDGEEKRVTETIVLYDLAGEAFASSSDTDLYAPFVQHADGIIMLIDPMQFPTVQNISEGNGSEKKGNPITVLNAIHNKTVAQGRQEKKCETPIAVCISKADCTEMQKILGDETIQLLLDGVTGIPDGRGYNKALFNMEGYRPLEKNLRTFFQQDDLGLATLMLNNYASYNFFAFSSLGQESRKQKGEQGEEYQVANGNVVARRIEEPLLWLFYQFGYIGRQGLLEWEYECPNCGAVHNHELQEGTQYEEVKKGFLGLKRRSTMWEINRECDICHCKWNTNDKEHYFM